MRNNLIKTSAEIVKQVGLYWKSGDWKLRLAMVMPLVMVVIYIVLPWLDLSDRATHGIAICVMWVMIGPLFFSRLG